MNADAKEHLYESVGKSLLVGRVGEACEIARAYLFPHAGGIRHGADRGVRWRSGTRLGLGTLPLMSNFQVRVGRTADAPPV